jgi:hypothetical protein
MLSAEARLTEPLGDAVSGGAASRSSGGAKLTLYKKINQGGRTDVQKWMMEAAMFIQSQKYM